jgi:hypothetical protein
MTKKRTIKINLDRPLRLIVEAPDGGRAEVIGVVTVADLVPNIQTLVVSGTARPLQAADLYPEH